MNIFKRLSRTRTKDTPEETETPQITDTGIASTSIHQTALVPPSATPQNAQVEQTISSTPSEAQITTDTDRSPTNGNAALASGEATRTPANKKKQKQQLFRALNTSKELLREPFLRAPEMQALYRNGAAFQLLQSESKLLSDLPNLLPNLNAQQHIQIENLELSIELLQEKKAEIDLLLPPFLAKESKLKTDIQAFTKAVKETQSKHKLSPDWDGKKPALMNLGDLLQERREAYNQEEEKLTAKTEKLYALHAEFYQEFSLFCEGVIPLLEEVFQAVSQ
ncbi:MAG: hypothetical protein R3Y06_11250 [Faecalibacterium sp.]